MSGERAGPRVGVVLAGGGTGGHIHPNLALAERLEALAPRRCRFVFVTSDRAIDARVLEPERIRGEPVERTVSPAKPLHPRPLPLARFVWSWGGGVRAGRRAVRSLDGCDRRVMIATGGFVSAPAVFGGRAEGIERWVVNLDAVPGKANRLAAKAATRVYQVGQRGDTRLATALRPIVRDRLLAGADPSAARRELGLDPDRRTLLVTGGSQGAGSVNGFVLEAFRRSPAPLDGWQVIHQTGSGGRGAAAEAWRDRGVPAIVSEYVDRMDLAWAAADAAVCRGGAGTVADIWATGTPALILPYPYHRDRHQRLNAQPLVDAGSAAVIEDRVDAVRNADEHTDALLELLDEACQLRRRQGFATLGPADGADRLAQDVLNIDR